MRASILSAPYFHDEAAATKFIEARVWPAGPVCPHCGGVERIGALSGKSTRVGVWKCYACRKPFTVKIGTIFEDSHVELKLWLQAIFLVASSKKGISANQLHRTLGVTLKTAWFMGHRIREAMKDTAPAVFGGQGSTGIVEADETYFGKIRGHGRGGHIAKKRKVLALMERGGAVQWFHVPHITVHTVHTVNTILKSRIAKSARLMTDSALMYKKVGKSFKSHETVNHHDGEYARGDVTTNTIESFFGVLKRGMFGTYQHCAERHFHRYLAEFDFRHNNRKSLGIGDWERANNLLSGVVGKRLRWKTAEI